MYILCIRLCVYVALCIVVCTGHRCRVGGQSTHVPRVAFLVSHTSPTTVPQHALANMKDEQDKLPQEEDIPASRKSTIRQFLVRVSRRAMHLLRRHLTFIYPNTLPPNDTSTHLSKHSPPHFGGNAPGMAGMCSVCIRSDSKWQQ
jgi:hypothetical protein